MKDLIKILAGVASAKLNLLETLKFADNVELTVHFHLGNELYPSAIVQVHEQNSEDNIIPKTFALNETEYTTAALTENITDPAEKEVPFNIGSHIVLDEKFFSYSTEDNFQHSNTVQFVPAYKGKAVGVFMDGGGRTFNLEKVSNLSFYIHLPLKRGPRKKFLIKKNYFTITEKDTLSWDISKVRSGEFIKIPNDSLAIVSFDESAIAFAFLISRNHYGHQTQHWIVAFPAEK